MSHGIDRLGRRLKPEEQSVTDFYAAADADPSAAPLTREFVARYARNHAASPRFAFIDRCKAFSMLHHEVLLLLNFFARRTNGPVLEIGPYIGGSTVAIARGLKEVGGGPLVTVEGGTSYDHDQLPSKDIVGDLRRNLTAFGVSEIVKIVLGYSPHTPTRRKVGTLLQPNSVGFLVVDANGFPGTDLWLYDRYLKDGCILVFDDYESEEAPEKSRPVRRWIAKAMRRQVVEELGVFLWGTWVGIYRRPSLAHRLLYRLTDTPGMMPLIGIHRSPRRQIRRWLQAMLD